MTQSKPYILGLTGPIASGKSYVESLFQSWNVPVIDTDKVAHDIYAKNTKVCQEIATSLEADILTELNTICRNKLRQTIQENPEKLAILEAIIHPAIRNEVNERLHTFTKQGVKLCVLTVPMMFESIFKQTCDSIVTCNAPEKIRRERALKRPNITNAILDVIINKQKSSEEYCQLSDHVINTDETLEETETAVKELLKTLKITI